MTTGALVASMILVWRVLTPFYSLCTMIPRLEQLRNSVAQVNKLMELDTEAMEAKTTAKLPTIQGKIDFQAVGMRYNDDGDLVLNNLTFNALAGDLITIYGENGTGKSSLLKLIKGMYPATSGMLRIDGFDIRQLDTPDLRRQIAYVPQQPHFFKGSIRENLRFGNPVANDEQIQQALEMADAWDDVQTLTQGLNTQLGLQAIPSSLSTRLSLARAYLHHSSILLIDELPNTLLGNKAGKNLKSYLASMKGKRSCIMVTHREDFMKMADTVIRLAHGKDPVAGKSEEMIRYLYDKEAVA